MGHSLVFTYVDQIFPIIDHRTYPLTLVKEYRGKICTLIQYLPTSLVKEHPKY